MIKSKTRKISISFRTSEKIEQKMLQRIIEDGYGLKGKSRWICDAVESFLAMPSFWDLVDIASAQEDLGKNSTFTPTETVLRKIEDAIASVRKHYPLLEGVQSNIIRASIYQKLI
ncbi:MAG: hypothetical protein WAO55_00225 [Candidatus Manganitrophaceae bacterium]